MYNNDKILFDGRSNSMYLAFSLFNLILIAVFSFILLLLVYALILSIKALKIYIEKNSRL
jgi:hypothetical protein